MIYVEYAKDGEAVSDFEVEDFVQREIAECQAPERVLKVANQTVIEEIRRRVAIGEIAPSKVRLVFGGENTELNGNGVAKNGSVYQRINQEGFCQRMVSADILANVTVDSMSID